MNVMNHARLFPLFFPGHNDVGLCPIRLNNSVVTLTLSGSDWLRLSSTDDNKLGAGHCFLFSFARC
jgi:hypothetical protein